MKWYLTVVAQDGTVLFGGNTPSRDEVMQCAQEARRLPPDSRIYIRPPMGGEPFEFSGENYCRAQPPRQRQRTTRPIHHEIQAGSL
jgi:hypothetical protein